MIYAYLRVSTKTQRLARQEETMATLYPNAIIYKEKYSAKNNDRPEFQKLLKNVKAGDTIVFDSVSRMSRNEDEGVKDYWLLYDKGVKLIFVKEPHIGTEAYEEAKVNAGKVANTGEEFTDMFIEFTRKVMIKQKEFEIRYAFRGAEKELIDTRVRVTEGLARAKASGKSVGRRPGEKFDSELEKEQNIIKEIKKLHKDFDGKFTTQELIDVLSAKKICSRNTTYKYYRQLKKEMV